MGTSLTGSELRGMLLSTDGNLAMREAASGDLDLHRYPWLKVRFWSGHNPARMAVDIRADILITAHQIRVGNIFLDLDDGRWVSNVSISDHSFAVARGEEELRTLIREVIRNTGRSLAMRLYEHDPRIGSFPTGNPIPLPRCPLFDPDSLFPRPQIPTDDGIYDPWLPEVSPPMWVYGKCRFCGEGFHRGLPPMWGGGNLLWVHQPCWMKAVGPK